MNDRDYKEQIPNFQLNLNATSCQLYRWAKAIRDNGEEWGDGGRPRQTGDKEEFKAFETNMSLKPCRSLIKA